MMKPANTRSAINFHRRGQLTQTIRGPRHSDEETPMAELRFKEHMSSVKKNHCKFQPALVRMMNLAVPATMVLLLEHL